MRLRLLVTISIVFIVGISNGQQPCSEVINTNSPTVNVWDWRSSVWTTNIYSTLSGQINSIVSPFHVLENLDNQDNASNVNINPFVIAADKDNKPEEGWELLKKNLGTPGSVPVSDAYVIFYNKYTGIIRSFFLVTQLFSETLNNDSNKGGTITLSFYNRNSLYQSNLLTSYSTPLLPLDQFKRDLNIVTANKFNNYLPYWLYADFPVIYDPCTCGNKGEIHIETKLINSGAVDIRINSLPYQSPIQSNAVNTNQDYLQSFSIFSEKVEGGLKATRTFGEATFKLTEAIAKQTNPSISDKLKSDLEEVKNAANSIESWVNLIPVAGGVVNSIISLLDFFMGGGKSSSGPAPVMIMNDFSATGTISSASEKNNVIMPLPGSDQTGVSPAAKPVYNNTLGVFNLLYTPEVIMNYSSTTETSVVNEQICAENSSQRFIYHSELLTATPIQLLMSSKSGNLKFALNPALNVDLSKSDIRCAYLLEGCDYIYYSSNNLYVDIEQNGKPVYRSSYHPISNFKNNEGIPIFKSVSITTTDNPNCPFIMDNLISFSNCIPKVYIKVVARLSITGSTDPKSDIVFIGKYPVKLIDGGSTFLPGGVQDIAEDVNLPPNQIVLSGNNVWRAQNSITASSFSNRGSNPLFLAAGRKISIQAGAKLLSGSKISVANLYQTPTNLASMMATSSEINAFCNDPIYKNASNRNIASNRIANDMAMQEEDEKYFSIYPNPTTGRVSFSYHLQEPSQVQLTLISTTGLIVAKPIDTYQDAGPHESTYDAGNLPAGIYICNFETSREKVSKRLVIIK